MMRQLTARMQERLCLQMLHSFTEGVAAALHAWLQDDCMQGGFEVSKEIKYADKAVYLPYRPMYGTKLQYTCRLALVGVLATELQARSGVQVFQS